MAQYYVDKNINGDLGKLKSNFVYIIDFNIYFTLLCFALL
jgi:hypothetical protein